MIQQLPDRPWMINICLGGMLALVVMSCDESKGNEFNDAAMDASNRLSSRDSGTDSSSLDANIHDAVSGSDAGTCDLARCPVADADPLIWWGKKFTQKACCTRENAVWSSGSEDQEKDVCGVRIPDLYATDETHCKVLEQGVQDDACLDTIIDGKVVQGCRTTAGLCGNLTKGWGCHHVYQAYWAEYFDVTSNLPNPFNCTKDGDPCTRTAQCCFHPNYGGACLRNSDSGDDGGPVVGYCFSSEDMSSETLDRALPF